MEILRIEEVISFNYEEESISNNSCIVYLLYTSASTSFFGFFLKFLDQIVQTMGFFFIIQVIVVYI